MIWALYSLRYQHCHKEKMKLSMKAGDTAPVILNLSTNLRRLSSYMPYPLYPKGMNLAVAINIVK